MKKQVDVDPPPYGPEGMPEEDLTTALRVLKFIARHAEGTGLGFDAQYGCEAVLFVATRHNEEVLNAADRDQSSPGGPSPGPSPEAP
jgi:hypothetical protein